MSKLVCLFVVILLVACQPLQQNETQTAANIHPQTVAANNEIAQKLNIEDQQDFKDAKQGLIAASENIVVSNSQGEVIWSTDEYGFIKGDAPDTVNPSLWRQEKLNNIAGLFKVTEGIYQLRGFDLANMTLIEGKTGWIVVDPLTSKETATTALAFARKHLGQRKISAIIFTHAHIDHFGGVLGIISAEHQAQNPIPILAPSGFMQAATSENIIAGVAMSRRAVLMYGKNIEKSSIGQVGSGLGKMPAFGSFGILPPNDIIQTTGEKRTLDGIDMEFQNAPGSEAPAEMTFYLPAFKTFMAAELISRNMHNLYTLRGAQVRDALLWSNYIDQALQMFAVKSDIYIASHHWPMWGNAAIQELLLKQRDMYKYIHDQSVRLINQGASAEEIAHQLKLPESLSLYFPNRGYYGSVAHNAKAVYQYYMGWYDANPANLNRLPKAQSASRYVELMGGVDKIMPQAEKAYHDGEFLWLAELLDQVVFAKPDYQPARDLLIKTYQQLGYQAESAPWRNVYLSAANELLNGAPEKGIDMAILTDVLRQTPVVRFFESMAVRLDAEEAGDINMTVRISFSDLRQSYDLDISNAVLHHRIADIATEPDTELTLTHPLFIKMLTGTAGISDTLFSDDLQVNGSVIDLVRFFSLFDKPDGRFNIIEP